MWMAILLEKTVSFHGIHCFISKKQAVNAERRFLPCKRSECMLEQFITVESEIFPCCTILLVHGIQHAKLPELVWSGWKRVWLVTFKIYSWPPDLASSIFAAFLDREVNLWVGGDRNLEKERLEGMKQQWGSQAGLSVRLWLCFLLKVQEGWFDFPSNN